MAEDRTTTTPRAWHHHLALREELINSLSQNPPERRRIEEHLATTEEELLDLPSPDLKGVELKLELLWDGSLHGNDQDSRRRIVILQDLHRLAA